MLRKTVSFSAIIAGLVCAALLLVNYVEPGRAQDEPPLSTSAPAQTLPAPTNPPDTQAPATVEEAPPASVEAATAVPTRALVDTVDQAPAATETYPVPPGPSLPTTTSTRLRPPATSSMIASPPGGVLVPGTTPAAGTAPRLPAVVSSSGASEATPTIVLERLGTGRQPAVQAVSGPTGGMMGQAELPAMMGSGTMGGGMMGGGMGPAMGEVVQGPLGPQFQQRLGEETRKLRQAATPEEKQQATEALGKLLGEYFDSDMQRRQADLDKVRQRVARLEELLNKRQAAKQEIVDLQLKTMVNESEGLGFFSTPAPGQPGAITDPLNPQLPMGTPVPGSGMMPGMGMPGMWPAPQAVR